MIKLNYSNIFSKKVGKDYGMTEKEFRQFIKKHQSIIKQDPPAFVKLAYNDAEAEKISSFARQQRGGFQNFVHIGIGGSIIPAIAISKALLHPNYNDLEQPRLFFLDNLDPAQLMGLFEVIDPKKTLFYIVTKSGETTETVAIFSVILERLGSKYRENIVISTDPLNGFMRKFASRTKVRTFDIPPEITGRYSALTSVGLFPAAFAGIDIFEILDGARRQSKVCTSLDPYENISFLAAAICYTMYRFKNKGILCLMSYSQALEGFCDMFSQLWSESLGKKYSLNGRKVHEGQTVLTALGPRDQHSLLQLLNEGPNDKLIKFLSVQKLARDTKIYGKNLDTQAYLKNKKVSEIIAAQKTATEQALTKNKRPNFTLKLDELSARTIGELITFLQVETVFFARFINVNPFDQPGVDLGKSITINLLKKRRT